MIRIFSQYVSPKSLLLVILESGLIILSLLCGARLRFWGNPAEFALYVQAPEFAFQMVIFTVTLMACFYYSDLYDLSAIRSRREQLVCLGQSFGAACLLLGLLYFIFPTLLIGRGVFFISTALVATLVWVTRMGLDTAWRIAAPTQKILVLGSDELAATVVNELVRRGDLHIQIAGFLKSGPAAEGNRPAMWAAYARHLRRSDLGGRPSWSFPSHRRFRGPRGCLPVRDLVRLRVLGVRVEDAHTTVSSLSGRIWLDMVRPSWFVFSDGFNRSRLTPIWKRIIDLAFGLLGLLLASPLDAARSDRRPAGLQGSYLLLPDARRI